MTIGRERFLTLRTHEKFRAIASFENACQHADQKFSEEKTRNLELFDDICDEQKRFSE
jgi:hypothetical protein